MRKALIITGCILYVLSPIDLIVDVIPVIGWIDDVAAIVLAVRMLAANGGNAVSVMRPPVRPARPVELVPAQRKGSEEA